MTKSPSMLKTWSQLFRLPNLFTVPGDALAGGVLVSGGLLDPKLAWASLVVMLLYMAGLLLNDFFDRKEDAEERPERPIPAGQASPHVVLGVGLIMIVGALGIAWLTCGRDATMAAGVLTLCIVLYDAGGRKIPVIGQLLMGACRGGSVAVGAYAMGPLTDWSVRAIAVALVYTAAITVVAAKETSVKPPKRLAFFPGLILVVTAVMIGWRNDWGSFYMPAVMLMGWGAFEALLGATMVARGKLPVPPFIGRLIRIMLTVQTGWIMMAVIADRALTLGVLLAFLITRYLAAWASKYFYAS